MINVIKGNVATVGAKSYAIKMVGDWTQSDFNTPSFQSMATVAITITHQPFSTGVAEDPETVFSGFCSPLDPAGLRIIQRVELKTPSEALQTFIADDDEFKQLVLEEIKT